MVSKKGKFVVNKNTKIILGSDSEKMRIVAQFLRNLFSKASGFDLNVEVAEGPQRGSIYLDLDEDLKLEEGYQLNVESNQITLKAQKENGLYYGAQTIRQLLPADIEKSNSQISEWEIPAIAITDAPRFEYRGMHLDVGRHMFPVDFIKKYIDYLAMHKMNRFHWHLTEDQGWRIEIKKYPKLTKISSQRKETVIGHAANSNEYDGKPYGGFYTQEEVKEIVEYARQNFITVIPEIEMPGHSKAVLAAYPEFGCRTIKANGDPSTLEELSLVENPYEVGTTWGVYEDIFCPTQQTFTFLEDVLTEVFELFPSEYIHIGGDEAPKKQWENSPFCQELIKVEGLKDEHELQSYFITRMEKFINSKGRQIIGWDEILEGGLAPNATVMSWRGVKGGIEAAKQGHNVVMTPGSHCYFDHYQSEDKENEPLAIGGFTDVEKVYSYEPVPDELSTEESKYVLGAQGNVWTEYMKTTDHVEYMIMPRMTALSEVVWSTKESRNWQEFRKRLDTQFSRFDAMGINYARHLESE